MSEEKETKPAERSVKDMFINLKEDDIDVEPTPAWVPWALAAITWILLIAIALMFLGDKQ